MNAKIDSILNYDVKLTAEMRALTGAFYTPLALAISMIEDATCQYLMNIGYSRADALAFMAGDVKAQQANSMLAKLSQLHFIDMACGTGVFGFARLLKLLEWQQTYKLQNGAKLLETAMQGMVLNDVNAASVAQFNTLVEQYFGVPFRGLLLNCDALLELAEKPAVRHILSSGGFDMVIGNPPYIGERGHTALFAPLKNHKAWAKFYQGKMDYSYFFVHQAINLLSQDGVITQIMTSYFTTADNAAKLRSDIKARATWRLIRYYDTLSVFNGINSLSFIIFSLTHKKENARCSVHRNDQFFEVDNKALYNRAGAIQLIPQTVMNKLSSLEESSWFVLGDILAVNQGLVSGADRFKRRHSKLIDQQFICEKPIFVFEENEITKDQHLKPFLKNSDIAKYQLAKMPTRHVLYSAYGNLKNNKKWQQHLKPYKSLLERRREVKSGARAWYELQWPRAESIFTGAKIVAPQRSATNTFAYVEAPFYGSADVYFLSAKPVKMFLNYSDEILLKGLTMYLNSKVVGLWLYYKGKRKGSLLELYATPLKQIPLPNFKANDIKTLAKYYDDYIKTGQQEIIDKSEQLIERLIDE